MIESLVNEFFSERCMNLEENLQTYMVGNPK
jgi:hypothetical protein